MGLFRTATAIVSVILCVILLSDIHIALGLLVLLALPPLGAPVLALRHRERAHQRAATDTRRDERLHRLAIDADSAQQIRVMSAERLIDDWADAARARQLRIETRGFLGAIGWEVAGWVIYAFGFAATLVITVAMVGARAVTLGGMVLSVTLATRLQGEVRRAVAALLLLLAAASSFGVTMVLPIGGADMPVVISLLNAPVPAIGGERQHRRSANGDRRRAYVKEGHRAASKAARSRVFRGGLTMKWVDRPVWARCGMAASSRCPRARRYDSATRTGRAR